MYSVVLMAALTAGTTTPSWGSGCHGCSGGWGGCHGCHGLFAGRGCHGCHGWAGRSCYGGGHGCQGASSGCYGYACYCYGGCYGGSAAGCYGCYGGPAHAPAHAAPAPGGAAPEQVPAPKKEDKSASLSQARLIVELPADAKLYVDDRLMQTTSERRVFNSPRLEEGQTYYYILRAEVVRDGQTLSDTKRVLVHAGEVIQASFRDLAANVAQAEANAGQ